LKPADASAADWIVTGLRGFAESVVSLVPDGFAAYVRVFHPAYRGAGAESRPVSWAEIAAANGTHVHAGMQLGALTNNAYSYNHPQPGVFDRPPEVGSLPPELATPLAGVLARHTTTPERCWFAVWNGFGPDTRAEVRAAPTFQVPAREYHLLQGTTDAITESVMDGLREQSPNIWWPDDRLWCVATEIDLNTTYIGCADACHDDILALPGIEALEVDPATGVSWRSDLLNPLD
jgi:hypothetical protein